VTATVDAEPATAGSRIRLGYIILVAVGLATAIYAALRLFTGFTPYDDEGSLLLMSRWLMNGHAVYRDFQSVYGPFYFLYKWIAHSLLGGSVSHATARVISIVPWVLTAMVAFSYMLRMSRSRALALIAWLAVLRTLNFLVAEPGQAQEICILLIVLLVALASRPEPRSLAIAGALIAALFLTKVNLGVYVGAGLVLAGVSELPAGRGRVTFLSITGVVCVLAPALLMLPILSSPQVWANCALLALSILPVVAMLAGSDRECALGVRHFGSMVAGFVVCAALVLSWCVAQGASLAAIFQSALIANLAQAHTWSLPLPMEFPAVLAAAVGPLVAALWLYGYRHRAIQWIRLGVGVSVLLLVLIARIPWVAFGVAVPFVWMVLLPGADAPVWPRRVLAAVTVLQALNVYPVAGSQVRFTIVLLTITAALNVHDSLSVLVSQKRWSSPAMRRAEIAAALFVCAGYLVSADVALAAYLRLPSLDLPGAQGVHLEPADRYRYHWIVSRVRNNCDSLVSFPAIHSVYLWTGMVPPVYPDVDGWQAYTNAARQAVERSVLASPRACVVISDPLTRFWLPAGEATPATLLGFIRAHFVEVDRYDGLHFLVRRP
jgi:hypothetical protein